MTGLARLKRYLTGTRYGLVAWAYVLLLPFILWASLPALHYYKGGIDAYIYSALIHDYGAVMDRFGPTYYAARIGHIYPAIAFETLFGQRWGYIVFHYAMMAIAAAATFIYGRRVYSLAVGVFGATLITLTPWLMRGFISDHYDGTAAVYLLVAQLLALYPSRRPILLQAAAGCVLALAAQTQLFTVFVFVTLFPSWVIVYRHVPIKQSLLRVAAGVAGFLVTFIALSVIVQLSHPAWAGANPGLDAVIWMANGGASNWFMDMADVMDLEMYYSFAPLALSVLLIATAYLVRDKIGDYGDLVISASLNALSVSVFYLACHFVFKAGFLHLSYYMIYVVPSFVLVSMCLVGIVERILPQSYATKLILGGSFLMVLAWLIIGPGSARVFDRIDAFGFLAITVFLICVTALFWYFGKPKIASILVVVAVLLAGYSPFQANQFQDVLSRANGSWDIRTGGRFLMDEVNGIFPPKDGPVGFWYPDDVNELDSIQSTFLWGFTRVMPFGSIGLPVLDEATLVELGKYQKLVLLAPTDGEIEAGLQALSERFSENDEHFEIVDRGTFDGETTDFQFALLKYDAFDPLRTLYAPSRPHLDIALESAVITSELVQYRLADDGASVQLYPSMGGYSVVYPLPDATKAGHMRIDVNVISGRIGAVITKADDLDAWLTDEVLSARDGIIDIALPASEVPVSLLLRNLQSDAASEALIRSIRIFTVPGAATQAAAPSEPVISILPLDAAVQLSTRAQFLEGPDGTRQLTTDPGSGGYTLHVPLPELQRYKLRLRMRVDSGRIGCVITSLYDGNAWLSEEVVAGPGDQTLELEGTYNGTPQALLLRNGSGDGPSRATISSIEIIDLSNE